MDPGYNPLLTDLYQLNMIEAYLAHGETNTATFELFVRELPRRFSCSEIVSVRSNVAAHFGSDTDR